MSSGNHILLKLLSENQFSGKTYFHTIAYRRGEEELRGRRGGPAARAGRRGDAGVAGQEGDGQEEPGRQFDSIKITSGQFWRPAFISFRPNGPMGASYLIIWANGSFSFSQNEMNAD